VTDSELKTFCDFVRSQMGLDFQEKNWGSLRRTLSRAATSHGFESAAEFARWVRETSEAHKSIDILSSLLTIGETFFFRDMMAFEAIGSTIIPQLIESKKEPNKTLKVWSAGCSSGEEPHSIAVLLKRNFRVGPELSMRILGTDINQESLKKAQKGVYKEWSFRGAPDWLKRDYFSKIGSGYHLNPLIRAMVDFRRLNLVSCDYTSILNEFGTFDLILCRNTLMYFTPLTRNAILENILLWLNEGGWLILSPSEVPHIVHRKLQLVTFPGAIFFRKQTRNKSSAHPSAILIPGTEEGPTSSKKNNKWFIDGLTREKALKVESSTASTPIVSEPATSHASATEQSIRAALEAFEKSDYLKAVTILKHLSAASESKSAFRGQTQYLLAKAYANLGMLIEAQNAIEQAIKADKINVTYHHMYASILQAADLIKEACERLQKVLFLDPHHLMATVTLGTINKKLNNRTEALRHMRNAMNLLKSLSPEDVVPDSDGETAAHLEQIVKSAMDGIEA
jgi:chemotaxis protein methyltransferase CheR